jgi:hypothetical protein
MRRGSGQALGLAIASVLALAGCGGGGSASGTSKTPATARSGAHTSSEGVTTSVPQGQLSVAEELGPDIVAIEVVHAGSSALSAKIHVLTGLEQPTAVSIGLRHGAITGRCGIGCYAAQVASGTATVTVDAEIQGSSYAATLPVAFTAGDDRIAATLLARMDAGQERMQTATVHESIASSPAAVDVTNYQIEAPNRFAYALSRGGRLLEDTIIIGTREWNRDTGQRQWHPTSYGTQPFSASNYLDWWAGYDGDARVLDLKHTTSGSIADVASVTNVPGLGLVWLRFRLDVTHPRLIRLRMITDDHFMSQAWSGFDAPAHIVAPSASTTASGA